MRIQILGVISASALLIFFNNCGGKMSASSMSQESASSLSAIDHGLIPAADTAVFAFKNSSQVADNLPLALNTAYDFQVVGDNLSPLTAAWTSSCTVTGSALLTRSITCSAVGNMNVSVTLTFANAAPMTRTFSRAVTATEVVTPPTNLVTFNIPAGTGNGRWNALATPVVVFKGQTLRVVNKDAMVHRLHTGGNPCPHQGPNIATDQFYDCVVAQAHSGSAGDTYDHNVGTSANFYINAIDGTAQYTTSCASCHGALATSTKKNRTFAQIKAAIAGNVGGMGSIQLSDDQVRAIEYQLSR